jgi:hypothetical protein
MTRFKSLKGHRLIRSWSGAGDTYANGRCECGWHHRGWTTSMRSVINDHHRHVERLRANDPWPGVDVPHPLIPGDGYR